MIPIPISTRRRCRLRLCNMGMIALQSIRIRIRNILTRRVSETDDLRMRVWKGAHRVALSDWMVCRFVFVDFLPK